MKYYKQVYNNVIILVRFNLESIYDGIQKLNWAK